MRIAIVTDFHSLGMGYTENCLPKALAALGHDVHVVSSNLNIYGNFGYYKKTYEKFLGPAEQPLGTFEVDGYTLHRLPFRKFGQYLLLKGLLKKIKKIKPQIVQPIEHASLNTYLLAISRKFFNYRLFTECHQHLVVVRPYVKDREGPLLKKSTYYLTRTLPGMLVSQVIEKCYAISPDCSYVAHRFYGVPRNKLEVLSLGTDTSLFHPPVQENERVAREELRRKLGFQEDEIVCIYTGRFSQDKNPLLLAKAVTLLREQKHPYRGLFVGDGPQDEQIKGMAGNVIVPFVRYDQLGDYYRASDIGVWPTEASMSMLDAAACGLPLVVSDRIGERERVEGNGLMYSEGDGQALARVLLELRTQARRQHFGEIGGKKMVQSFSWLKNARQRLGDYHKALA